MSPEPNAVYPNVCPELLCVTCGMEAVEVKQILSRFAELVRQNPKKTGETPEKIGVKEEA